MTISGSFKKKKKKNPELLNILQQPLITGLRLNEMKSWKRNIVFQKGQRIKLKMAILKRAVNWN